MKAPNTKGKELLVRKRMATFLEKLLRYFGHDFRHDLYKQIVYAEADCQTPLEDRIKNYYDAYVYLLNNHKNPFSQDVFKRFLYILTGKEADYALLVRVTSLYYHLNDLAPIEKAIEFHMQAFNAMPEFGEELRTIVSLMLFNYTLVKDGIPAVKICGKDLNNYFASREKYIDGNKEKMYKFAINLVVNAPLQDKSYYKNLLPISVRDIYNTVLADKEILLGKYGVLHIGIFGSFAKGNQRIDSDIDLLVVFSDELILNEKLVIVEKLAEHYFKKFNRFVDINEVGKYVIDEMLKETHNYKKIF